MTLFSLAEIKHRNEYWRDILARVVQPEAHLLQHVADIDALIEEIERLRSIRLPSGNDR